MSAERIDRTIVSLLVNPNDQRPWSEHELARELLVTQAQLTDRLERLHDGGLIHRFSGLVSATHAAVRMYEIEQAADPVTEGERRLEEMILVLLLSRDKPLAEHDVIEELGDDRALDVTNALENLDGVGLIDRSQTGIQPTQAARCYCVTVGTSDQPALQDADARE